MSAMASQITSLTIVCSNVYSGADQRKYQSSASLAFVRGIHRWPMNSPHKGQVTRKKSFHLMTSSWFSRTRISMAWPEPCQLFSSSSPLMCPIPVSPWHARPPCMHAAGGLTSKDTPIWCPPRAKCQEYYPLPTCSKCSVPVNPRWLTALFVRTNP